MIRKRVSAAALMLCIIPASAHADVFEWSANGQPIQRDTLADIDLATPQVAPAPLASAEVADYRDLAYRIALGLSREPGVRAAELSATDWADLFVALVARESAFDPRAVSPAGAQGLAQLMPATARALGVADPFDPVANLDGGARYLAAQLERFGDVRLALAAYNAGPERVVEHGGIPPFRETRAYVPAVLSTAGLASGADDGAAPLPVATTEKAIWQW